MEGWSEMYPPYEEACDFSDATESESEVRTHFFVFQYFFVTFIFF